MTVERTEIRVSSVSHDWVGKGCHLHVGRIEIALRPSHLGEVVYRGVFASSDPKDVEAAGKIIQGLLMERNHEFLRHVKSAVIRARQYLMGVDGEDGRIARGRLYELRRLELILERMEQMS